MITVVAVWSGLALDGAFISKADIPKVVQYGLDQIEFLTGDASTKWGAVRASLGYKKPWKVKWVEIGNEDWLAGRPTAYDTYKEYRFQAFLDAFTKKHPDIQIIASPSIFDNMTIPAPAAGDIHPYWTPDEFAGRGFGYFDQLTKDNLTLIGMLMWMKRDWLSCERRLTRVDYRRGGKCSPQRRHQVGWWPHAPSLVGRQRRRGNLPHWR